jgi:16S rRNA (cytidine1402-2'-O)-methyltransferase
MPKLFLIPNTISEREDLLPDYIRQETKNIHVFFVEDSKSARKLLKGLEVSLHGCIFLGLNEHTALKEIQEYVKLLKQYDCAIVSQAGCPCVADPGADLVLLAHQNNIEVVPLVGPSSILLALMASGLNGQNFAFNGYLPKSRQERIQKLRML